MAHSRSLVSLIALVLIPTSAIAGAPAIEETCRDKNGASIPTQVDLRQRYFALAAKAPARGSTPSSGAGLVIYINPERTYLGRQTQQWLYLRQCAHIVDRHQVLFQGEQSLNIRDEEAADCWAAKMLTTSAGSSRVLYSIESDMDRLAREPDRWREVLPGPQRRISFSSCGK